MNSGAATDLVADTADRLAYVAAAVGAFPSAGALAIDLTGCFTGSFVLFKQEFLAGAWHFLSQRMLVFLIVPDQLRDAGPH